MTAELRRFVDTHSEPGRRTYVKLRDGPIVQGILDEARVISADLIVMGTHGRSGFERFILGSVTEKILRKAPCPVFTVTPGSEPAPTVARPFNAIVCPVDFSLPSHKALSYAQLLARQSGKRLILVHVLDLTGEVVPPGLGPEISAARRLREDQARHELHALVPEAVRQWCECTESVAIGRPYEEILRVAEDSRADLIVMGVHGRNSLDVALFGSTTNQVVRSADCPVLTVRS